MVNPTRTFRALLFLLLALPIPGAALNDTDAVLRKGLFPLAGGGRVLEIVSEKVAIEMRGRHLSETRTYGVRSAETGAFRLATACGFGAFRTASCRWVEIDGRKAGFRRKIGRLVDRQDHVAITHRSPRAIAYCDRNNDGDICGHSWIEVPLRLERGKLRTVAVRYEEEIDPRDPRPLDAALDGIVKFWAGIQVPRLEFRFGIAGQAIPLAVFQPRGQYARDSQAPTASDAGWIVWRFESYPIDHKLPYGVSLVHPFAIDLEALQALNAAAATRSSNGRSTGRRERRGSFWASPGSSTESTRARP
jgi:hypothetical protein